MKEKFYTIYQTTNMLNGMIYIGHHSTYNLNDKYMGSGIDLNKAIHEEGIENFKRETLFIYDNKDEMKQKEKELVSDEFRKRQDTYNIALGGGQIGVKLKPRSAEFIEKQRQSHLGVPKGPHSEEHKRKLSESHKGKRHTEETKQLIREKRKLQVFTKETCEKISKSNIGKKCPRTPEQTERQRLSHTGTKHGPQSQEHKEKRIESYKKTILIRKINSIVASLIISK